MTDQIAKLITPLLPIATNLVLRIVGVLIVLWIASRLARRLGDSITHRLEEREFDQALSMFFGSLVRWSILIGSVLACLSVFGVQTTSFAAVIGAAGLAVGLAFQGTLSNFAAGVMLLVFRPFRIGDVVSAAGQTGGIIEIGLFTTTFDTPDNRRIIVPNSAVFGGTIENITHHKKRRVDIDVGVDYDASIGDTRAALERAVSKVEDRLKKTDHQVFLSGLGGSSVDWKVRVWCKTSNYWLVWEQTITAIKEELDAASIGIPYPNMDIHVKTGLPPVAAE